MPQGLQYMLQNQDVASSSASRYPKGQDGPCEIRSSVFIRSIIGWKSLGLNTKLGACRRYEWQILGLVVTCFYGSLNEGRSWVRRVASHQVPAYASLSDALSLVFRQIEPDSGYSSG